MNNAKVSRNIINWLKDKAINTNKRGFALGVSGGVDSGLVSTLCAMTGMDTILIQLPINRKTGEIADRADAHCNHLASLYENVTVVKHDTSEAYNSFVKSSPLVINELALANLASRFRMCAIYSVANSNNCLVAGTGNKVEDFGIGFFTKYGDGGVDISPIGDLLKSEVRELAEFLGVAKEIVGAIPTDELWSDTRSDETAIGATYPELEVAMERFENVLSVGVFEHLNKKIDYKTDVINTYNALNKKATKREKQVFKIFLDRHLNNKHKMNMPPVCELNDKN